MTTELTATAKTSSPPKNSAPKKSKAKTATKSERKKKHVNKKSPATSSSTAAALYSAARLQYHKLLKRRDAELNDHVWLSKDPLSFQSYSEGGTLNGPVGPIAPDAATTTAGSSITTGTSAIATTTVDSHMMESPSFLEQDVEIVHRALFRNGLSMKDVTIDAFNVLLEEARKYAMELIADAADCAVYSHGNDIITPSDLLLAKEMETEECCFSLENLEEMSTRAKEVNNIALPPIPDTCYNGIVLPDSMEDTLLNRAFDVVCRRDEDDDSIQQYENKVSSLGGSKDVKNLQSMLGSANGFTSSGVNMKENGMAAYGAKRGSKQMQILLKKSLQTQGQEQQQSHNQQRQPQQPQSHNQQRPQPQQSHNQQQPQPQGPAPSSQPSTSSSSSSNENNDTEQVTTDKSPETSSSDTKGALQESVQTTTMIHDSNPNPNKDEATNHPFMNKTDKKDQNTLSQEEQLETLPDADFMDLS